MIYSFFFFLSIQKLKVKLLTHFIPEFNLCTSSPHLVNDSCHIYLAFHFCGCLFHQICIIVDFITNYLAF